MNPTELDDLEKRIGKGQTSGQGVMPHLEPEAEMHADNWLLMRQSTPADHPISFASVESAVRLGLIDPDGLHRTITMMHLMDRTLFEWQSERRENERKQAEEKRKRKARQG